MEEIECDYDANLKIEELEEVIEGLKDEIEQIKEAFEEFKLYGRCLEDENY